MKNHIPTNYYRDVPLAIKHLKADYKLNDTDALSKFAELRNADKIKIGWPPTKSKAVDWSGHYHIIAK